MLMTTCVAGVFDKGYWDVEVTVAKQSPKDVRVQYTVTNRGKAKSTIHVIPQLWFRYVIVPSFL